MRARPAIALCVAAILIGSAQEATAQADAHERAIVRASCQSGKQLAAVVDATAALERDPNELEPRIRLADALVDQGCYQEAVSVLEAGEAMHPHNSELTGKLRDVRSLVTEQTYIEGLTQAAEGAKFQRNQLRCTRLADVSACDDALKFKPDDVQLLLAKGDALLQANNPADAMTAYRRASQLKPGDEGVKAKLAAAEALRVSTQQVPASVSQQVVSNTEAKPQKRTAFVAAATPAARANRPPKAAPTATGVPSGGQHLTATPVTSVAALEPPESRTYSNDAPAGRTN